MVREFERGKAPHDFCLYSANEMTELQTKVSSTKKTGTAMAVNYLFLLGVNYFITRDFERAE